MDLEVQDVVGGLGGLVNDVVEAKMGDVAKEYDVGEQQVVVSGKERVKWWVQMEGEHGEVGVVAWAEGLVIVVEQEVAVEAAGSCARHCGQGM